MACYNLLFHLFLNTCLPLSSCRLTLLLWSYLAVGKCSRMGKILPAVARLKVASQTSSSTRGMALRRQIEHLTRRSKQAVAPQAHLRPSLWTNQSCNAA